MPTLPERATSITAVLGAFAPARGAGVAPASDAPVFDWRAIVQAKKPGAASEGQSEQAARLKRTLTDLRAWAEAQGLSPEHLEESAVYATVCTTPDAPAGQVRALATAIFWIYLVDDFLDRRDFARDAGRDLGAVAWALDTDLAAMLRPLSEGDGDLATRARAAPWWTIAHVGGRAPSPDALILGRALDSLLATLHAEWATLRGGRRQGRQRRSLVAGELACCLAAMRTELLWNVEFARRPDGRDLPAFVAYARNGAVSIGMPVVAAVAASFEACPRQAWRRARGAVASGGAVVRLTNDLHTYFADADEGKASAVTLRLRDLGLPLRGLDPDASPEVRRAQATLGDDLARIVDLFARAQAELADGPLPHCVRHAVAFALAVYGDGSRHREGHVAA